MEDRQTRTEQDSRRTKPNFTWLVGIHKIDFHNIVTDCVFTASRAKRSFARSTEKPRLARGFSVSRRTPAILISPMLSDDAHYMHLALDQARAAEAAGEVPVGAIVVQPNGPKSSASATIMSCAPMTRPRMLRSSLCAAAGVTRSATIACSAARSSARSNLAPCVPAPYSMHARQNRSGRLRRARPKGRRLRLRALRHEPPRTQPSRRSHRRNPRRRVQHNAHAILPRPPCQTLS